LPAPDLTRSLPDDARNLHKLQYIHKINMLVDISVMPPCAPSFCCDAHELALSDGCN
jgi:hypothetical protein